MTWALAGMGLAAVALVAWALLRAWTGWLELRRLELEQGTQGGARPDVSALKARIRRLEAITDGRG